MSSHQRLYSPDECGPDGYPFAWHNGELASIKDHVRAVAGYRCERCSHPYQSGGHGNGQWSRCDKQCRHGGPARYLKDDGEWSPTSMPDTDGLKLLVPLRQIEAEWRILTVHHLNGDKADCRWWNLASLCQRCHLTIQGRVRMEQIYPYEHSEWFKPHAAGYYASTYLGEDLNRDETLARIAELLALECLIPSGSPDGGTR